MWPSSCWTLHQIQRNCIQNSELCKTLASFIQMMKNESKNVRIKQNYFWIEFYFQDYCHQVADKYIEFEPLVIIIDLILISRPTYRHVLYNINFKVTHFAHLRMAYSIQEQHLIWNSFHRFTGNWLWLFYSSTHIYHGRIGHTYLQSTMRILLERNYITFVLDYLALVCLIRLNWSTCEANLVNFPFTDNIILYTLLALSLKKCVDFQSQPNRGKLLCKAMCLANIAKFFLMPIVIWKSQQSEFAVQLNFMIVMGYFLFSLIHVYSGTFKHCFSFEFKLTLFGLVAVISGFSRIHSAFSVISSLIIKAIMFSIFAGYVERHLFPLY